MNNLFRLAVVGGLLAFAVLILAVGLARRDANLLGPVHLLLFVIGIVLYVLPTLLALYRDCKSTAWIAVVNVLLGWTIFGWFVAIGWAASGKAKPLLAPLMAPPERPVAGH